MRDLYEVLLQKEKDILRVRREIEALRFVLPLLADDPARATENPAMPDPSNKWPLEVTRSR